MKSPPTTTKQKNAKNRGINWTMKRNACLWCDSWKIPTSARSMCNRQLKFFSALHIIDLQISVFGDTNVSKEADSGMQSPWIMRLDHLLSTYVGQTFLVARDRDERQMWSLCLHRLDSGRGVLDKSWDFSVLPLAVQWLRLCTSNAGCIGLIPGQGTKIPRDAWPKKKREMRFSDEGTGDAESIATKCVWHTHTCGGAVYSSYFTVGVGVPVTILNTAPSCCQTLLSEIFGLTVRMWDCSAQCWQPALPFHLFDRLVHQQRHMRGKYSCINGIPVARNSVEEYNFDSYVYLMTSSEVPQWVSMGR